MRSLVTIGGEPFSSVASATNSSATSDKPTHARKARAGIVAFRLETVGVQCASTVGRTANAGGAKCFVDPDGAGAATALRVAAETTEDMACSTMCGVRRGLHFVVAQDGAGTDNHSS